MCRHVRALLHSRASFRSALARFFKRGLTCLTSVTAAFLAWSWHEPALAYCTLTDCREDAQEMLSCKREDGCIVEGIPLYPKSPCFQYTIAAGQAQAIGLSDAGFQSIVQRAFGRWQAVDCGNGRRPGFRATSAGVVELDEAFACNRRRLNVDTWLLVTDWNRSPAALGYTVSTHAVGDGEVFDADVEINASRLAREVSPERLEAALLSVSTHEAGHVLGLHHSNDPSAVMAATYGTPEDIRDLTPDDIEGVCNLFPDDPETIICAEPVIEDAALSESACLQAGKIEAPPSTCNVSTGRTAARGGELMWFAAASIVLGATRKRRTHRPRFATFNSSPNPRTE